MRRDPVTFDRLPLFASDKDIGEALLGVARAPLFKDIVPELERRYSFFPKVDPTMGGRYVPAIKQFFDYFTGMSETKPSVSDGIEDLTIWQKPRGRQRQA